MAHTTDIAIVGAGPYGLSVGAYLHRHRARFRIFGHPMQSWQYHMPAGMHLKSEGFASNLYAPSTTSTLKSFCQTHALPYADSGIPVPVETLVAYGKEFQQRYVPELESRWVESVERAGNAFGLQLDDGTSVSAKHVILAVGITHFPYLPNPFAAQPRAYVTHSHEHHDLGRFRGRDVIVIGAGASALDLAGLLHAAGTRVRIISRRPAVRWCPPPPARRSTWQRLCAPQGRLGTGWKLQVLETPALFYLLPAETRRRIAATWLGPMGGWFMRALVDGCVSQMLGHEVTAAAVGNDKIQVQLRRRDGAFVDVTADHVICATGYKADVDKLSLLSESLRAQVNRVGGVPLLSRAFESSVPGLYFVGLASAANFGPSMRFMAGAEYTARTLATRFR